MSDTPKKPLDAYDAMIEAGHDKLRSEGLDFTPPPAPKRKPFKVGQRVTAMPGDHSLDAAIVTALEWKQRGMQCPYDHPPQWTWEWRVTVMFGDGTTRDGIAREWISNGAGLRDDMRPYFETAWAAIESMINKSAGSDALIKDKPTGSRVAGPDEYPALRKNLRLG